MELKTVYGIGSFLMIASLFVFGVIVTLTGIGFIEKGVSGGNIEIVFKELGKITGLNGQTLVFVAGVVMVIVAVFYSMKALNAARFEVKTDRESGKTPDKLIYAFIKHFSPGRG